MDWAWRTNKKPPLSPDLFLLEWSKEKVYQSKPKARDGLEQQIRDNFIVVPLGRLCLPAFRSVPKYWGLCRDVTLNSIVLALKSW